jgi:hypothetical protein
MLDWTPFNNILTVHPIRRIFFFIVYLHHLQYSFEMVNIKSQILNAPQSRRQLCVDMFTIS